VADIFPERALPSRAAIERRLAAVRRGESRGLAFLSTAFPVLFERYALQVLLCGGPDAAERAERLSKGVLSRIVEGAR
jgi:hypothetical protein